MKLKNTVLILCIIALANNSRAAQQPQKAVATQEKKYEQSLQSIFARMAQKKESTNVQLPQETATKEKLDFSKFTGLIDTLSSQNTAQPFQLKPASIAIPIYTAYTAHSNFNVYQQVNNADQQQQQQTIPLQPQPQAAIVATAPAVNTNATLTQENNSCAQQTDALCAICEKGGFLNCEINICKHRFHLACIEEWMNFDYGTGCPDKECPACGKWCGWNYEILTENSQQDHTSTTSPEQTSQSNSQINSFTQWQQECIKLADCDGIKEHFPQNLTTFLKPEELQRVIAEFTNVMHKELQEGGWIGNQQEKLPQLIASTGDGFFPFVQKKMVDNETHLLCCSDIHGDIKSLNAYLNYLHTQSKIMNDNFVITDKNIILVFQGDYVDGGWNSIEVLYILMRLKIANPDQVIILRGNHENKNSNIKENDDYMMHFQQELIAKYHDIHLNEAIYSLYNLMPAAAYIGTNYSKGTYNYCEYSLHTHAFIEIGFDPLPLLNDTKAQFAFVPHQMEREKTFKAICTLIGAELPEAMRDRTYSDQCTNVGQLGFVNGDIKLTAGINDSDVIQLGKSYYSMRTWGYNRTSTLLNCYTDDTKHNIVMLVRGHQHVPDPSATPGIVNPLFPEVCKNGCATCWQDSDHEKIPQHGIWQNEIVSLWSSPEHTRWNHFEGENSQYEWKMQSIAHLVLNQGRENWKLYTINIPVQ